MQRVPLFPAAPLFGLRLQRRRRHAANMPNAPLSKSSAELGSGPGATEPVVIVIVSTKKSHPFTPAFGVVIVTGVIGCAAVEAREKSPNPVGEKLSAMLLNICESTVDQPERASTS